MCTIKLGIPSVDISDSLLLRAIHCIANISTEITYKSVIQQGLKIIYKPFFMLKKTSVALCVSKYIEYSVETGKKTWRIVMT